MMLVDQISLLTEMNFFY